AVGEVAQAPIFALFDLAALFRDQLGETVGQGIDLRAGDVLARDEHILVERHHKSLMAVVTRSTALAGPSRSGIRRAGKGAAHYSQTPRQYKRAGPVGGIADRVATGGIDARLSVSLVRVGT